MASYGLQGTLLLVEDDLDNRELMQEVLESMGHRVTTAANAGEALERARETRPDVVISDVGLPDMGGLELASELRSLHPGLPIVVVTGFNLSDDESRGVRVLMKPVDADALESTLQELLSEGGHPAHA